MKKIKVMTVFGTRPEAIKMAPVVKQIEERSSEFELVTVVTGQHREMLDQVLSIFSIHPNYDLNVMKKSQTLDELTNVVISKLGKIIDNETPDIILVHGDTTTTFAASVSAFYHHVLIGHVEAGLRTWNKQSPFPEEMNRQMTDVLSDMYFAPTVQSKHNLLLENHSEKDIFVTGNTAIDALQYTVKQDYHHNVLDTIESDRRIILVTMHRRENQGEPMKKVLTAIREIVDEVSDIEIVYPVHYSPAVRKVANEVLGSHARIHLIDPLDVVDFHNLAARSFFIMTDSGGIQEEAPSLGKPVLVLRDTTERPEGVEAGTLQLVGTNPEIIKKWMRLLLSDQETYSKMSNAKNPYGDGLASKRILDAIHDYFRA